MKTYLHSLLNEKDDPVVQQYLEFIKNGIPKPKGSKKDVLVIGAGMAGMVSASMLRQVGHNVTIVEANTRVGGRVKTFRNTAEKKYWEDDSLYAEAGAMRLPNFHYMVMEYCKQLNVTLEPFYYVSVDKAQALNNKEEGYRNNSDRYPKKTLNSYLFVNYKQVVQKDYYSEGADINALLDYHLQANKNRAQSLVSLSDPSVYSDLTAEERAAIVNFLVP